MGLLQKAVETYDCCAAQIGQEQEGREPFAPVFHWAAAAEIEITLNADGKFVSASARDKKAQKIIFPVTEASASRTSSPAPHPLCEQLGYLVPEQEEKYPLYVRQLREWAESPFSHPKLMPILTYVESGTILSDLSGCGLIKSDGKVLADKDGKKMVCWRVIGQDAAAEPACRRDQSLFNAYIAYVKNTLLNTGSDQNDGKKRDLCMISGEQSVVTDKHAKGIVSYYGNAKLISANDDKGYTWRGRFDQERQAVTVGYEASQKAHNALHWLADNQGEVFGKRIFICWNPQGIEIPRATGPFRKNSGSKAIRKPSDYRQDLRDTLSGHKAKLPLQAGVVIAAFDASTKGRLSAAYYNELAGSDFYDRLCEWDEHCCWYNGPYGIQSPSLYQILQSACGVQRTEKGGTRLVVDDRISGQQMQRLVACRVDQGRIPEELKRALANRASMPQAFEPEIWQRILFASCAVMNKYCHDTKGEDIMSWELDTVDRSFQFGRLLAAADWLEEQYYRNSASDEARQTTAVKAFSECRRRPWHTYERINRQLLTAYLPRVDGWARTRYNRLTQEIIQVISTFPPEELNRPLEDTYLMGYSLQKNALYQGKSKKTAAEADAEETEEK